MKRVCRPRLSDVVMTIIDYSGPCRKVIIIDSQSRSAHEWTSSPSDNKILTVVAVFLNNGKLLMEQRGQDRRVYAGYLMCPSGHVEVGETIGQTLPKEMLEELGIIVPGPTPLFIIDNTNRTP